MEIDKIEEPFYFNERVDIYKKNDGIVQDAQIISIRGTIIQVKYITTGLEENIHLHSEDKLVLKQWKPGRAFQRYNRIDFQNSESGKKYYEAIIIEVN